MMLFSDCAADCLLVFVQVLGIDMLMGCKGA
jgi:hypothetical protein